MAVKWESVNEGDQLWDVHSQRAGNTKMRRMGSWPVKIISIDHAAGKATVSWNGNAPKTWFRRQVEKLRRKPYEAKKGAV